MKTASRKYRIESPFHYFLIAFAIEVVAIFLISFIQLNTLFFDWKLPVEKKKSRNYSYENDTDMHGLEIVDIEVIDVDYHFGFNSIFKKDIISPYTDKELHGSRQPYLPEEVRGPDGIRDDGISIKRARRKTYNPKEPVEVYNEVAYLDRFDWDADLARGRKSGHYRNIYYRKIIRREMDKIITLLEDYENELNEKTGNQTKKEPERSVITRLGKALGSEEFRKKRMVYILRLPIPGAGKIVTNRYDYTKSRAYIICEFSKRLPGKPYFRSLLDLFPELKEQPEFKNSGR